MPIDDRSGNEREESREVLLSADAREASSQLTLTAKACNSMADLRA
jgi:hypothetical protein